MHKFNYSNLLYHLTVTIMKTSILSLVVICCLSMGLMLGCQDNSKEDVKALKPKPNGAARIGCSTINFGFMFPDNDYGYNGNGCVSYFIHRGTTRQFKIKASNFTATAAPTKMRISFPNNGASVMSYSVASYQGSSVTPVTAPYPGTQFGAYIDWDCGSLPAYTTYELTLNVAGGYSSGENGVQLELLQPCPWINANDCNQNDSMHLVLAP
jgi:hypothetical protein